METGVGDRAIEGSVMEITNSCDFLGSRYPWVTDGRSLRAACRVSRAACHVFVTSSAWSSKP
jgi:hypothetical protein